MQPDHRPAVSGGATTTVRAWRLAQKDTTPPDHPPDPPKLKSDLGSDDEWHFTMASDSDVASEADPESDTHSPLRRSRSQTSHQEPADDLAIQWNDDDMEHFVEDVKDSNIPTQTPAPFLVPQGPFAQDLAAEPMAVAYDDQVRDAFEQDATDQLSIIPGFHGVTSREVLSADVNGRTRSDAARLAGWADRPRTLQNSLLPGTPGAPPVLAVEAHSSGNSPGTSLANRVGSDSALSSHNGSLGSGTALHTSARTSSDDSDVSRKGTAKSVSFVTQNTEQTHLAFRSSQSRESQDRSSGLEQSSDASSEHSSGYLRIAEQKVSGLRLSLRESKSRLSAARLTRSKRNQKRGVNSAASSARALSSDMSEEGTLRDSFRNGLRPNLRGMASSSRSGQRPLSTRSDGYARKASGLSQNSTGTERQVSTPQQSAQNGSNTRRSASSDVFFERAPLVAPPSGRGNRQGFEMGLTPQSSDFTFLECVIEVLKGATVLRRKSIFQATEVAIWLTPDMQAVKYRIFKKGSPPVIHELPLMRVRKLKQSERELSIEMMGEKKPIDFIFPSKSKADEWLSGLCCLIPTHSTVKSRNKKWDNRVVYDPLNDSWNGKPLSSKKRLNEYILLGSIGRGSFGKVKVALSENDRQFYAVKVVSKELIRKRNRNAANFERSAQESRSPKLSASDVNEIRVMKNLDHKNVMKLKGVFDDVDHDRLYIVLEYLAKGPIMSSSRLTGAKPLTEDETRVAFVDVLSGLEYLHHNRVAHLDIKPDNLLCAGDGTVKISDFGAALLYDGERAFAEHIDRAHNTTVGTPAFTAPELCLNENCPPCPKYCYAADIWSLGATLFYMVYGRAPFIERSVFKMYDAICTQELIFPDYPAVSRNLQQLIQKMLVKSPDARATFMTILESPWLTESIEVSEKLVEIRNAVRQHAAEEKPEEVAEAADSAEAAETAEATEQSR